MVGYDLALVRFFLHCVWVHRCLAVLGIWADGGLCIAEGIGYGSCFLFVCLFGWLPVCMHVCLLACLPAAKKGQNHHIGVLLA